MAHKHDWNCCCCLLSLTADYGSQPKVLDPVRTSFWDLILFLPSFF
ncbi:Signal peptidase complex subunit SPC3 [Bienertia sinuspersici]